MVILGGGVTGCEMALALAQAGKQVTVLEMAAEPAADFNACNRTMLLEFLGKERVDIRTNTRVEAVKRGVVEVTDGEGRRAEVAGDTIVNALGAKARTSVVQELQGLAAEVHVIGDAVRPRIIYELDPRGVRRRRRDVMASEGRVARSVDVYR